MHRTSEKRGHHTNITLKGGYCKQKKKKDVDPYIFSRDMETFPPYQIV